MQAERDLLHQSVFPELRRKLKKYNEDIQELDLRWGVDTSLMTEEESGKHVIESCIDSIDRCRPYMIVLIGERYGWIPDEALIANTHDDRIKACYDEPISITQMEILYGALEQKNLERCIFCFRDEYFSKQLPENIRRIYEAESNLHSQKLTALKTKIRNTEGAKIIEYQPVWDEARQCITGLEDFEKQVLDGLWNILEPEVNTNTSLVTEEYILKQAHMTAKHYVSTYVPREKLDGASILNGRGAVWYYGAGGSGKSAFLSSIYDGAKATGNHVFIYYCGNENCGNVDTFLNTLHYWLKKENGMLFTDEDRNLSRSRKLQSILALLNMPRTCDRTILIDGVDQLEEDILNIVINIAKAVIRETVGLYTFGFAVTSTDTYYRKHSRAIEIGEFTKQEIGTLSPTEIISITQLHARNRGKHLDSRVQNAIRSKKSAGNPHYLSLLLQELFMMTGDDFAAAEKLAPGMEGLSLYMENVIQKMPDDLNEMTIHTLSYTIEKMKWRMKTLTGDWNSIDPMDVFTLLAVSQNGLTLKELEEIAAMDGKILLPMEMHLLLTLLYNAFQESSSGRWDFSHRLFRENILAKLSKELYCKAALLLCRYAKAKESYLEAFYYAFQSEDKSEIREALARVMTYPAEKRDTFFRICQSIPLDFEALDLSGNTYGWFLAKVILSDPDKLLKEKEFWMKQIEQAQKHADVKNIQYQLSLAKLPFLKYEQDAREYISTFQAAEKMYFDLEHPESEDTLEYLKMVLSYLPVYTFQIPYDKIAAKLQAISDSIHEYRSSIQGFLNLMTYWQNKTVANDADGREIEIEELDKIINYTEKLRKEIGGENWDSLDSIEKIIHHAIMLMFLPAASRLAKLGVYKKAMIAADFTKEWIQNRINSSPTVDERLLYLDYLSVIMMCVKTEYRLKHITPYRTQAELLVETAPFSYCQIKLADTYYNEYWTLCKLEKESKQGYDHDRKVRIALREGIKQYDALFDGKRDDEKLDFVLESACYLRFRQVGLRLEHDIWNWEADKTVNIMRKIDWFEDQMKQDLERLESDGRLLYSKNPTEDNLYGLLWNLYYGFSYYELHQEKENMLLWKDKLFAHLKKAEELDPTGYKLVKTRMYMEIAEAMVRWSLTEYVSECLANCTRLLDAVAANTHKYDDKIRRYHVRKAIVLLKSGLFSDLAEAESIFEKAVAMSTDFDKDDNPLLGDLRQSMAELYHLENKNEKAVPLLVEMNSFWQDKESLWLSHNEKILQRRFRYLQGQRLLAELQIDAEEMKSVCSTHYLIVSQYSRNEETTSRPLLLAEAKLIKNIYETQFSSVPLPGSLTYVLLLNDTNRKAEKYKEQIKEEALAIETVERWEQEHTDHTTEEYFALLKKAFQIQGKLFKNVVKDSEEYQELWKRHVRLVRKRETYYWQTETYKYALGDSAFFLKQIIYRKELLKELYSLEEVYDYYKELVLKRGLTPYIGRDYQVDWLNVAEGASEVCELLYQETGELKWLWEALNVYKEQREHLVSVKPENPNDLDWILENIRQVYTYEQKLYVKLWKTGLVPETQWLTPLANSILAQLQINISVHESYYTNTLSMLYELQDESVKDQITVQKAIDLVVSAQSGRRDNFTYYMRKAVRDLPSDTPIEEVMAYIEKLKTEAQY